MRIKTSFQSDSFTSARNERKIFAQVIGLFLFALCSGLNAETEIHEDCSAAPLCVTLEKKGSNVTVSMRNPSTQDASAEFQWQLENMQHLQQKDHRYVIQAGETILISKLRVRDEYRPSRYGYSFKWVYGNSNAVHDDSALYLLPYKAGTQQYVSQSCNGRMSHNQGVSNNAIDFNMRIGTKIYAARAGKVVALHEVSVSGGTSAMNIDDANYVRIQHKDGTVASYVHLRTMGVKVNIGDNVEAGQFIAYSGDTGYASGPHLHFQVLQTNSVTQAETIAVKWKAARGVLTCPRRGLALKSTR